MEARSFSPDKSQQLMRKVKEYKADLKKITEDSRQAQGAAPGDDCLHPLHMESGWQLVYVPSAWRDT